MILSSTLVATEPTKSEQRPAKNLATTMMHHAHFVLPYYLASVHTPRSMHANPALAVFTFQVKVASVFAAGEDLARATNIVKSDSAAAHALTAFMFMILGYDSFFPVSRHMQAAAINEAGLAIRRLIQELGHSPYITHLAQQGAGFILFTAYAIYTPLPRLAPVFALMTSQMAGGFAPSAIAASMLRLIPTSADARRITFFSRGYAATTLLGSAMAFFLGRGQTRVTIAFATFGAAKLLNRGAPSRILRFTNAEASGMLLPLAFELVKLSKYFVTSLSWTPNLERNK